jgi:hypothetical protein
MKIGRFEQTVGEKPVTVWGIFVRDNLDPCAGQPLCPDETCTHCQLRKN